MSSAMGQHLDASKRPSWVMFPGVPQSMQPFRVQGGAPQTLSTGDQWVKPRCHDPPIVFLHTDPGTSCPSFSSLGDIGFLQRDPQVPERAEKPKETKECMRYF